jgi:hypothetical protein
MSTDSELLPCPFCGGPATLSSMIPGSFIISCFNADCFGPVTSIYGNREDCVAAWNRRTPPTVPLSASNELVARIQERLDFVRFADGDTKSRNVQFATGDIAALLAALAEAEKQRDEAADSLRSLLVIYVNRYCSPVPEWKPQPDLLDMILQMNNACTVTDEFKSRADAAEAQLRVAMEALRPFVFGDPAIEEILWGNLSDDKTGTITVKLADFRRARAALFSIGEV